MKINYFCEETSYSLCCKGHFPLTAIDWSLMLLSELDCSSLITPPMCPFTKGLDVFLGLGWRGAEPAVAAGEEENKISYANSWSLSYIGALECSSFCRTWIASRVLP